MFKTKEINPCGAEEMLDRTCKILVIEDDPLDLGLIERIIYKYFDKESAEVIAFKSYKSINNEMLAKADILLADLNTGGDSNLEDLRCILKSNSHFPIVVLSGNEDDKLSYELIKNGVSEYLFKSEALNIRSTLLPRTISNCLERKKLNNRLIEASLFKSRFLSNMSHEIRTPLNVISGLVEVIKENPQNPDLGHHIKILDKSIDSLLMLVNNIIDISKIESGEMSITPIDTCLARLVEGVGVLMCSYAAKKGILFDYKIEGLIPRQVNLDECRVKQVLINIIGNSIKFTNKGGVELKVQFDGNARALKFTISDTGIGIPKEKIGTIFEEFKQADDSTTREFGGSGLGLSIVKKLLELMHGKVRVESELGVGSRFTITIPCEDSYNEMIDYYSLDVDIKGKKILVIDNSESDLTILNNLFSSEGCCVQLLKSGEEAVVKFGDSISDFDIIFISVKMTPIGGFETYEKLSKKCDIAKKTIFMFPLSNRKNDCQFLKRVRPRGHFYKPIKKECIERILGSEANTLDRPKQEGLKISGKVLLAEDFEENTIVIKEFLKNHNICLDIASNGQEAFEMAKKGRYDLVLMDVQMPVLDGLDSTMKIREFEKSKNMAPSVIVALTANVLKEDRDKCLLAGCDDHLAKPIKRKRLLEVVGQYLNPKEEIMSDFNFKKEALDSDLSDYIPTYIKNRWEDYEHIIDAVDNQEFDKISKICHKILGSAQTYGLMILDELVCDLQKNAKKNDEKGLKGNIENFKKYLESAA